VRERFDPRAIVVGEPKRVDQTLDRFAPGPALPSLESLNAARTQARPVGQRFLRQPGRDAELAEQGANIS
jgi:hypothetical protein